MKQWNAAILCLMTLAAAVVEAPEALAQRGYGGRSGSLGPLEFSANYGSMWGGHINTTLGTLRVDTGDSWYFAADLPLGYGRWGEFSYTRQGTRLNLENLGIPRTLSDMTVHYWQLGAIQGVPRGNFVPFVMGSLGLTHYSPDASTVQIGNLTLGLKSATKFSMTLGAGFKTAMGPDQRIGIRAQFRLLPTLYDAGAGLWVGSGGAGISVGGSAIWQYEVSGGLVIKLGRS